MKLLLLLSALLAALSGAGASARAPQAQPITVAARVVAAPAARAHIHVPPVARRYAAAIARAEPAEAAILLPALRLWAERRRE